MAKEFFKNLPDKTTPLTASRINGLLNGKESMGSIVVEDIESKNLAGKTVPKSAFDFNRKEFVDIDDYFRSDFIKIEPQVSYVASQENAIPLHSVVYFDATYNALGFDIIGNNSSTFNCNYNNVKYAILQFNSRINQSNWIQLEKGTIATPYTPHKNFNTEVKNDKTLSTIATYSCDYINEKAIIKQFTHSSHLEPNETQQVFIDNSYWGTGKPYFVSLVTTGPNNEQALLDYYYRTNLYYHTSQNIIDTAYNKDVYLNYSNDSDGVRILVENRGSKQLNFTLTLIPLF